MSHLTYRLALILLFLTQIYLPSIVYGEERDLITDFGFSSGFYTAAPFLRYEKYNPPEYFSASARTCEREKSIFADSGQLLLVPGLSRDNSAWKIGEIYSPYYADSSDGRVVQKNGNTILAYRWANPAKAITVGRNNSRFKGVALKTVGYGEYGGRWLGSGDVCAKRAHAHLMLSQRLSGKPIQSLNELRLTSRMVKKIANTQTAPNGSTLPGGYNPSQHGMHFRMNIDVQNLCGSASCGHGQSVNLGFLIYDNRYPVTPKIHRLEKGRQRFLFRPNLTAVEVVENGKKRVIRVFSSSLFNRSVTTADNVDILPIIKETLRLAKESPVEGQTPLIGSLAEIHKNYHVVNINIGWENSSLFTGEIQISDLSLVEVTGKAIVAPVPALTPPTPTLAQPILINSGSVGGGLIRSAGSSAVKK